MFECPENLPLSRGSSYIPVGWSIKGRSSVSITNKSDFENIINTNINENVSFNLNVSTVETSLTNCNIISSNNNFTVGDITANSINISFISETPGLFETTITIEDKFDSTISDSVVLTVNVNSSTKSYYLRYGTLNNDNYNTWTNEITGTELDNGNIVFEPLNFSINNNFVALTTKPNDTSLSTNVNISDFTNIKGETILDMSLQNWGGKSEYRISVASDGDYSVTVNLSNKTISATVYSPDEPVNPDEPADPAEDTDIKVATYNIRYYNGSDDTGNTGFRAWPNRKDKVFEMIRKHDMDVCGLQEVTQSMSPDIISSLTEYTYVGYGRDSGLENSESSSTGEQTGLIYKKDKYNELARGRFFLSSTPDSVSRVPNSMFNRLATWVKLQDKETLKEFIFASTHFDHPTDSAVADSVREQQAQYAVSNILSIAGNLPIFFVGDFNAESNTSAYNVLTSTFNDSYNFLPVPEGGYVCNVDQINSGKCPGCSEIGNTYTGLYSSSDIDPKRIDYVFYLSDKSSILSYLADTDNLGLEYYPSDHLPVVCDMVIQ